MPLKFPCASPSKSPPRSPYLFPRKSQSSSLRASPSKSPSVLPLKTPSRASASLHQSTSASSGKLPPASPSTLPSKNSITLLWNYLSASPRNSLPTPYWHHPKTTCWHQQSTHHQPPLACCRISPHLPVPASFCLGSPPCCQVSNNLFPCITIKKSQCIAFEVPIDASMCHSHQVSFHSP